MKKKLLQCLVLMFISLLARPTLSMAQQPLDKHVNITLKKVTVKQLLDELNRQTGLNFVGNAEQLATLPPVSVDHRNKSVRELLDNVLGSIGCTYEMQGNVVTVKCPQSGKARLLTGFVGDEHGEPLTGARIKVGNTFAIADAKGQYKMMIPCTSVVATITFVGMETTTVKLKAGNGPEHISSHMKSDNALDEVVVTGYFEQAKKSFTGAARTITADELMQGSNQNILTALQNVDPSFVMVENNLMGSNPNSVPQFQIRGSGSLTSMSDTYKGNPNMPVFIVDGFETTAEKVWDMDPYRVKNITLLKDAAATAIYGSRASNGVVVITTNTPKHGKLALSYNTDMTFYIPDLSAYTLCNPEQKLQLEVMSGLYDATKKTYYNVDFVSDQLRMDEAYNRRLGYITQGVNTDWLAQPLHQLVVGQKHSIRIDGGSENFRYAMDLNYSDTPGVMRESGRERMGIGVELQYIHKNVTFRNQMTFSNVNAKNSPYGSFADYTKINPYCKVRNADGSYIYQVDIDDRTVPSFWSDPVYNPLYNTTLNYRDESAYNDLTNQFGVDWHIVDGLRLKGTFAFTVQNTSSDVFKSGKHTDFASFTGDDFDRRGSYVATKGDVFNYDGNIVLSYFKQLGKHVINGNLGWNIQQEKSKDFSVKAEGFPNDNLDYISFGTQYEKNGSPSGNEYTSRLMGFLGNVNYSYDERYLLDLSFREDASSRFGANNRWAPFWSAGIGWNMANEPFMKEQNIINLLKLRATYGLTGSQNFDPYQAMTTYEYLTGLRYHYGVGATLMAIGNDDLAWQRTHETNVGIDLGLWNDRLQLTFDYYVKNTKDLLTSVTLPPSLGFTSYMANLGEVQNKGWELNLKATVINDNANKLYWSLFGSMIHNTNKLMKISDALKAYNDTQDTSMSQSSSNNVRNPRVRFVEGESINSIWVNQSLGVDPLTGREMFLDRQGNKVSTWSVDNYVIGGCTDPAVEGTFGTTLSYKGFQLNATFRYRIGGQMYNQTLVDKVQDIDPRYNCDVRALTERWQKPGDIARYTAFIYETEGVNIKQQTRPTSRFVEDYNYLTMSTLNLSYEFDNRNLLKYGIQRLKLLFYMNDVFYTSTVKMERGTDYPYARNFSVGLNVRF
ncbi:MAG: SusC/RagA family TonB-linked outer membrane protein [Prevotellaceae bacterium]|nr:SusC/RagA family TonB-linked outer membrane protein [Prevotellaceae bacterium]